MNTMKAFNEGFRSVCRIGLITTVALLLGACSLLGPRTQTEVYETKDGAIVVESVKLTATVTAIDERNRTLTLDPRYGDEQVFKAPPEMVNFNQVRVGDEVQAEIIEEFAVSLVPGGAPESVGALDAVALAPLGGRPAMSVAVAREVTADVIAIDAHSHRLTLEFVDGTVQSFKVGKHIDLSEVSLGDSVRIVIVDAIAIDFQKKG